MRLSWTPTRSELRALANELRHAHTRLLPLEIAERVQHTIVRLEDHLVSPTLDPDGISEAYATGKQLVADCEQLSRDSR
ncbi:MAG TPA: hypothetical protein VF997_02450 [Polyangia bacterium]